MEETCLPTNLYWELQSMNFLKVYSGWRVMGRCWKYQKVFQIFLVLIEFTIKVKGHYVYVTSSQVDVYACGFFTHKCLYYYFRQFGDSPNCRIAEISKYFLRFLTLGIGSEAGDHIDIIMKQLYVRLPLQKHWQSIVERFGYLLTWAVRGLFMPLGVGSL